MKRLIAIAAALALAACASPRNATIEDGKVSNVTSAEATTLMLGEQRRAKVQDVQTNQKPIVRLVANAGKPITIDAAEFEVYVPLDLNVLMAERASEVSENVQMAREFVNGVKASTPIVLGGMALSDRNSARNAATEQAQIAADAEVEMETLRSAERADARQSPIVLTIPSGGSASVLTP